MTRWLQTPRARRWWVVALGLLLVGALAAWNWQGIRIWFHMTPIGDVFHVPPFDEQKAQSLSPERRAELERELFSELRMWNGSSRRYGPPNGRAERQARWVEMAQEGSELAYLTLKVLPPDGLARDPRPTLKRLEEMAQQGNAAAMCLYGDIVFQLPYWVADWTPQQERARYWTEKGAELRHPQCLIRLGGWRMSGYVAPVDVKQGSEMIFEAIHKGYDHWVGSMELYSEDRGYGDPRNRYEHYCWAYQGAKYRESPVDLTFIVYINNSPPDRRPALERELNELRKWHPSAESCIDLTRKTFTK